MTGTLQGNDRAGIAIQNTKVENVDAEQTPKASALEL